MPINNEVNVVGVRRSSDSEVIYTQEQSKTGFSTAVTGGNIDVDSLPLPTTVKTFTGTAGDSLSSAQDFGALIKTLYILAEDNGLIVNVSVDNVTYTDDIIIPKNAGIAVDISIRYAKFKNRTAGSNAAYTITGFK